MSASVVPPVANATADYDMSNLPPLSHPLDSPFDHRSVLEVVGWTIAIMTTLIVFVRMATKWTTAHRLELDDLLITISLALAFGQTASLSTAVNNGLGLLPGAEDLSSVNLEGQQKSIYAFNVLFIVSQCFAKVSVSVFTGHLTPVRLHHRLCKALMISISVWAVISAIALLFQCQMPRPWQVIDNKCVDRVSLYTVIETFNVILDVVLIAIPVTIVWTLNQRRARKLAIIGTFLTRSIVIATIIAQLTILHGSSETAPDPFLRWNFAICTQLIEYFSIVSACALYLKPFLRNAASGMLGHSAAAATAGGSKRNSAPWVYRQSTNSKFGKTKTILNALRDPDFEAGGKAGQQRRESTMNITVQRHFEIHEYKLESRSLSSSQSEGTSMERKPSS